VEEDFDIAMSSRRTVAMRALAEQEATSKAEAERRVASATEEANRRLREATEKSTRMVAEAEAEVGRLRSVRARISMQLRQVRSVLAEATDAIEPLTDEEPPGMAVAAADATRPMVASDAERSAAGRDTNDRDDAGSEEITRAMPKDRARAVAANRR
jgi:hypothetical protein